MGRLSHARRQAEPFARLRSSRLFKNGAIAIYPLDRLWAADFHDAYDSLQFYLPRADVGQVTEELTGKASKELWLPPHLNAQDQTVHQLGQLLLPALARPEEAQIPQSVIAAFTAFKQVGSVLFKNFPTHRLCQLQL